MADYSTLNDQELAPLIREGNSYAFTELFRRYGGALFVHAQKRLNDKEASQDVVQEVFAALWNSRKNLQEKISLAPYLYTAVGNRVLNIFRNKKTSREHLASLAGFMANSIANTDYLVREKDIYQLIEKEIAALPEKMRLVFIMGKKQFMSNKEIAAELKISEQTVETHMKRALKTLRLRLGLLAYLVLYLDLWRFKN